MSKEAKEETPLVDGDKKEESFLMKFAAPLALAFYIVVAVVKTMLTKVPSAPCLPRMPSALLLGPTALTCVALLIFLTGPLRGRRRLPSRLLGGLRRRDVLVPGPRLRARP